jgi:hypothetical protein
MPIEIKVKEEEEVATPEKINITVKEPPPPKEEELPFKMKLRARTALDGTIMITDHYVIDISVSPELKKVVVFPKRAYGDEVYAAQNRLFEHLSKAGIIDRQSIQGGAVHGALEGLILESKDDIPVVDLTIMSIGKFIEKEKPEYIFQQAYDDEIDDMYTEPTEEDSTRLGKVPQEAKKGSVQPYNVRNYLGSGF